MKKFLNLKTLLFSISLIIILFFIFTSSTKDYSSNAKEHIVEGEILKVSKYKDDLNTNSYFTIVLKDSNNDIVTLDSHLFPISSDTYNSSINNLGNHVKIEYTTLDESNYSLIQEITPTDRVSSINIIDIIETLEIKSIEPITFIDMTPPLDVFSTGESTHHYAIGATKSSYYTLPMSEEDCFVIKEGIGKVDWVPYDKPLKIFYVEYENEKVIINYEEIN